jgi:hypothetical protein
MLMYLQVETKSYNKNGSSDKQFLIKKHEKTKKRARDNSPGKTKLEN